MENKLLDEKWKVHSCFSGKECWCRMIVTEGWDDLVQADDTLVIGSAAVSKELAEYIVLLHNNNIGKSGYTASRMTEDQLAKLKESIEKFRKNKNNEEM